jgi:CRP/FNR family cyclic AMP-dependent transcriptional regulator
VDPDLLRAVPLLAELPPRDLAEVARRADAMSAEAGRVVVGEDREAYEFFIILEGEADVIRDGERIGSLAAGDFFGEIGLVETERRTATVTARTPMQLAVIAHPAFLALTRTIPELARGIQRVVPERLPPPARD